MRRNIIVYSIRNTTDPKVVTDALEQHQELEQTIPGLAAYSLEGSADGNACTSVVATLTCETKARLEKARDHPRMRKLMEELDELGPLVSDTKVDCQPYREWYRPDTREEWNRIEEIVDPKHTAFVVVDVQNDFCSEGGARVTPSSLEMARAIEAPLGSLLASARDVGVPVVYTQVETGGDLDTGPVLARRSRVGLDESRYVIPGTWGWEICDFASPSPADEIVHKPSHSAFSSPSMDAVLQRLCSRSLVVSGVVTNGCVEATVRDAFSRGYYAVVSPETVSTYDATLNEYSLTNIENHFGVVASYREIAAAWQAASGRR